MQLVLVKAARRVFPGILDIDADIVGAFNLDALDAKVEVAAIDADHALGCGGRRFRGGDLDKLLCDGFHSWEKVTSG